jgi:hypothetical protein
MRLDRQPRYAGGVRGGAVVYATVDERAGTPFRMAAILA